MCIRDSLDPSRFDPQVHEYLRAAEQASGSGYEVTFFIVAAIALVAGGLSAWLVRKPIHDEDSGHNATDSDQGPRRGALPSR